MGTSSGSLRAARTSSRAPPGAAPPRPRPSARPRRRSRPAASRAPGRAGGRRAELAGELARVGDVALVGRVVALDEGEDRDRGDDRRHARQRADRDPRAPAPRRPLALHPLAARGEEAPLQLVEVGLVAALPDAERGAPVELAVVAAAGVPVGRGVGEAPVQAELLAVVVDPAAQLGPAADEGLVGDVDDRLAGRLVRARSSAGAPRRARRRPRRPRPPRPGG